MSLRNYQKYEKGDYRPTFEGLVEIAELLTCLCKPALWYNEHKFAPGDLCRMNVVHPFDPISNEFSRILILGTMPSTQSRKANFYYSHPRNRFWQVLAICCGQPMPKSMEEKTKLLLSNGIALWDVLAACEIDGSDDSSIRKPIYNDIVTFISGKPIVKILCNGKTAYTLCNRLEISVPVLYLPSTSPANAAWNLERLTEAWKITLDFAL